MRTNNHANIDELFEFQEHILPQMEAREEAELRSVSARIPIESYKTLEFFSDRWGMSKSALVAQLLEVSLTELEVKSHQIIEPNEEK